MGPRESLRRCQDEMTSANTADERKGAGGRMGLGWVGRRHQRVRAQVEGDKSNARSRVRGQGSGVRSQGQSADHVDARRRAELISISYKAGLAALYKRLRAYIGTRLLNDPEFTRSI